MPVFGRLNGAWVQGDLRTRSAGAWTDERDGAFGRLDGAWVQCQPDPVGDLLAPANLAVDPTSNEATFTWNDPAMDAVPTDVQYRIPEITPVWTEIEFGINSVTWAALAPATNYQFQIRYVVRTDGEVTATGPTATAFFTTDTLAGPGEPAPDPAGSGPDAIVPWGPIGGTPGPVGGSDCWWGWAIDEFDPATYEWDTTAVDGEFDGDITELQIDFIDEGFACGATLRFRYREICNSVPQAWEFGSAFNVVCDYDDPCGAINQTSAFDAPPWTDALLAMPKICYENFKTNIEDYVIDGITYGRLPGLLAPLFLASSWNLVGRSDIQTSGAPLVAGRVPALVPLGSSVPSLTSDFSHVLKLEMDEQPSNGASNPLTIASVGDTVRVVAYTEGAGFRISAFFAKQGGGQFALVSSTELAMNESHTVAITIDQDGDKLLYIDGALAESDTDTTRANFGSFTGALKLYANSNMRIKDVAVWDRVLTADEVALAHTGLTPFDQLLFDLGDLLVLYNFAEATFVDLPTSPTYDEQVNELGPPLVGYDFESGDLT